jgi:hypothetical protein
MSILKNVFKREENISRIIFGALMVAVLAFVFGPSVFAQFTRQTGGYGYGNGYGYGYGYGFGSDFGRTGYRATSTAVNLGAAGGFAILTHAGITDVPTSIITGNIGTDAAGSAITGLSVSTSCPEVTGKVYTVDATGPGCETINPTLLGTAMTDEQTAYTTANGLATTVLNTGNGSGEIGGQTLVPGVYTFTGGSTNVTISTNLTLSGGATGVWVFQIPGTFDVATGIHVNLTGGAEADNVFWIVAGQTTLHATSIVNGTILDYAGIAMQNGAKLNGSAMSHTASVTLIANTITLPAALNEYGFGFGYLAAPNYTLTYTAGTGGSITGTDPQTVSQGSDGSAVTAVPASGYVFVNWSDNSTANPRTDTNVIANVAVTANFGLTPTTVSSGGGSSGGGGGGYYSPYTTTNNGSTQTGTTVTTTSGTTSAAMHGLQTQLLNLLITQLQGLLQQAQSQGMTLPAGAAAFLNMSTSNPSAVANDLTINSNGSGVNSLQAFLISKSTGPAAQALAAVGATGHFGALTQAALAEYQKSVGITPASGYFGPKTRAYLKSIGQ